MLQRLASAPLHFLESALYSYTPMLARQGLSQSAHGACRPRSRLAPVRAYSSGHGPDDTGLFQLVGRPATHVTLEDIRCVLMQRFQRFAAFSGRQRAPGGLDTPPGFRNLRNELSCHSSGALLCTNATTALHCSDAYEVCSLIPAPGERGQVRPPCMQ